MSPELKARLRDAVIFLTLQPGMETTNALDVLAGDGPGRNVRNVPPDRVVADARELKEQAASECRQSTHSCARRSAKCSTTEHRVASAWQLQRK